MEAKFGALSAKQDGFLVPVTFPSLATMDAKTGDGRLLDSKGYGVRDLPRTFFFQFSQDFGHMGSVPVGPLQEVTFEEDGNISGRGWLIDNEAGRNAALLIATKTQYHNSIDLAEVRVDWEWDDEDDDVLLRFVQWKIAATTGVGKPAFADAQVELDELVASFRASDEMLDFAPASTRVRVAGIDYDVDERSVELVASDTAVKLPYDDFHMPESPTHQKIVVTEDGAVFGHLGRWGDRHGARNVPIPMPRDNYASFNQAGPLTERGQIETGPIFFLGGHPDHPLGDRTPDQAYGGVENAWADVRVTMGRIGPWISGHVRPGMSEEALHVARCSRISGHWKGDDLVAIVSCNVAAFNVPGSGLAADRNGAVFSDGKLVELVASFDPPVLEADAPTSAPTPLTPATNVFVGDLPALVQFYGAEGVDPSALAKEIAEAMQRRLNSTPTEEPSPEAAEETADDPDLADAELAFLAEEFADDSAEL